MGRKKKTLPVWEHVTIEDVAAEGMALAHVEGRVVFVPFAVPGDVADLRVRRMKSRYAEAEVEHLVVPSPRRVEPFCPHFGTCGGCRWQALPYADQLRYKQRQVEDALRRIGGVELPPVAPILPSERVRGYRNKLDFAFGSRRWLTRSQMEAGVERGGGLGFHLPGAFDKVIDIDRCELMPEVNNRVRSAVKAYALSHGLTFYDARAGHGLMRGLMLRTSEATGEVMALVQVRMETDDDRRAVQGLLAYMAEELPEVTSLLYVDNHKCNDTIGDLDVHAYKGPSYIVEEMEGLRFRVGPKSFYQTNARQAYELYKVARRFAGLTGRELVYDLYTGTGTIACFVARAARAVVGIEYVPEAVEAARAGAALNGIDNATFFAGDMKDVLSPAFVEAHGHPDVVITDPPRAGMHPGVVRAVIDAAPARIVYVSCNPATQARDLALLDEAYRVEAVQPVDMFPQTHHVENMVLLTRRP